MGRIQQYLKPDAVRRDSVPRVDFHLHTSWTDGANTVRDVFERCVENGLETVLYSEHARRTSGSWFKEFASEVRALPKDRCRALVGIEVKVTGVDGGIDAAPEMLQAVDLVMASVHRFPGEVGNVYETRPCTPEEGERIEYELAMAVLENPEVDILGHPFGMCYRRFHRRPSPDRVKDLVRKAAATGVAFEINSRYHPDPWGLVELCHKHGAPIALGSNAHTLDEIGSIRRILEGKESPWQPEF